MTQMEHDLILEIFGKDEPLVLDRTDTEKMDKHNEFERQKKIWRGWFLDGSFTLSGLFTLQITPAMLKKKFQSYENFINYKPLKWDVEFMGVWW